MSWMAWILAHSMALRGATMTMLDKFPWETSCESTNFFMKVAMESTVGNSLPPQTIIAGLTAIHLNVEPTHWHRSVDDVAENFGLPNYCGALADYVRCQRQPYEKKFHVFGSARWLGLDAELPFSDLQIWHKVCLQQKLYHLLNELEPMFTVNAHPPDQTWKYGWYDAAILQVDLAHQWPLSSLTGMLFFYSNSVALTQNLLGHSIVLVWLIMCPMAPRCSHTPWASCALIYAQRLDVVPQEHGKTKSTMGLHVLKRAKCASGKELGEVFPLDQLRSYVHIVPHFGHATDNCLTHANSVYGSHSFFLNKYFDKDFFYAVSKALWC